MIRTLDRAEVSARLFTQPRPAVAADIVKPANFTGSIPYNDETFSRDDLDEIIA